MFYTPLSVPSSLLALSPLLNETYSHYMCLHISRFALSAQPLHHQSVLGWKKGSSPTYDNSFCGLHNMSCNTSTLPETRKLLLSRSSRRTSSPSEECPRIQLSPHPLHPLFSHMLGVTTLVNYFSLRWNCVSVIHKQTNPVRYMTLREFYTWMKESLYQPSILCSWKYMLP